MALIWYNWPICPERKIGRQYFKAEWRKVVAQWRDGDTKTFEWIRPGADTAVDTKMEGHTFTSHKTRIGQMEACVWLLVRVWSPPPRLMRLCPGAWREVSSNGDTAEKIYKAAAVRDTGLCNQDSQSTPNTCYLRRTCSSQSHPFLKLIFWANLSLIASTFLKSPII